jgi:ribosomal protein S6
MEKLNSSYETIFIVDLQIGDDAVKATVDKFLSLIRENGEITQINEWGKRRLAYPINDLNEGYYVLVNFTAPADFPLELERVYNITEGIMRSIVIKIEVKKKASDAKAAKPQVVVETAEPEVVEAEETAESAE